MSSTTAREVGPADFPREGVVCPRRYGGRCEDRGVKYMVLMYADPAATAGMSGEQRAEVFRRHEALHRDLEGTGEMLNGAGLALPGDTVTLRWGGDGGGTAATDGPFVAAVEQLTAYYVLECASPERAREIAERVLDFHVVAVEVRPVHDHFGMG